MRRSITIILGALALVALVVGTAGCGTYDNVGSGGTVSTSEQQASSTTVTLPPTETTAPPSVTTTAVTATTEVSATTSFNVYFSRDEKIWPAGRVIPKTTEVGAAAVKALLQGPTAEEEAAGLTTCIPQGTTFLGLTIKNGIATVNLSKEYASGGGSLSMTMRLAQVVFTLTQFPSVKGVNFQLDGEPVEVFGGEGIVLDHPADRSGYEHLSPAILVESPTLGQNVKSPLRVTGSANVFEAVFRLNLVNWDGLIIADHMVTASAGTGTRGTFDVTIPFQVDDPGRGALIAFSESPKDGSHINAVEIPLYLTK